MDTVFASVHIPFLQSSFVKMTAHMASSPLTPAAALARSFPLSPRTSASIPRSTMEKSMACTARLSLWFLERRLAVRISERMVFRIKARRDEEVVRGSKGKRDLRRLRRSLVIRHRKKGNALDGWDHIFVAKDDEILQECLAGVWGECPIVFGEKGGEMRRKLGGLLWITHGNLSGRSKDWPARRNQGRDLCDEGDEFSEMGCVVIWVDDEELPDGVVVVVLLQKLFLVPRWIAFDEIL